MKQKTLFLPLFGLMLAAVASAQNPQALSLIRRAQTASPAVKAAESSLVAKRSELAALRAGISPTLELAPGIGYTNGNAALTQELDFFGRRSATVAVAQSALRVAEIQLQATKAHVTESVLITLAESLRYEEALANAKAAQLAAEQLQSAVAKQVEIGEAPKVHLTRAELEVLQTSQAVVQAQANVDSAKTALASILGEGIEALPSWDGFVPTTEGLAAAAYDLMLVEESERGAHARVREVQSQFKPTLFAGVAADVWSLDRQANRSDNLGLQVTLRMPLFDRGQGKNSVRAAEAERMKANALGAEARRVAELQLTHALRRLAAARTTSGAYAADIIPKGEQMLVAMREGYQGGLVTLVEVLEAQQALGRLRQERTRADLELKLAEIAVMKATLTFPAMETVR